MRSPARIAMAVSVATLCAIWCFGPARAEHPEGDTLGFIGQELQLGQIVEALTRARPKAIKPVGTTSVVFRMDLEGPIDAAFKPETHLHPHGYGAEVAAFRLSQALALDNVAPAVLRSFPLQELEGLLDPKYRERWSELAAGMVAHDGAVTGAAIYWIPDMHELGLDTPEGMQRWARWLTQGNDLPAREKSRLIAGQVSTMVGFDYLIANWDRFSGANAQGDHTERRLFLRDHNVAFLEPLPSVQHRRLLDRLERVQRFSRSFVASLRRVDAPQIAQTLDIETARSARLLRSDQVRAVIDRRRTLVSYIAALIDRYGEENVLTFP